MSAMASIFSDQQRKGVRFGDLFPESELPAYSKQRNVEGRGLPPSDIPDLILLTDKEAAICFRFIGGRMDYAGFVGKDPIFLSWVKDLFLYYWEKGNRP
jgi:predicted transcriptional regulator